MPLTAEEFLAAARTIYQQTPDAKLLKNDVGNLTIVDAAGEYIGYVDIGSHVDGGRLIPGGGVIYLEDRGTGRE